MEGRNKTISSTENTQSCESCNEEVLNNLIQLHTHSV